MPNVTTDRVLALVLESLRTDDLTRLCRGHSIAPDELAALRDAFISAGAAGLQERRESRAWCQISVHLDSLGLQWYLFVLGDFQDRARHWIEQGIVDQFYFVHKPPGARVRFLGDRAALLPELSSAFDQLARDGQIGAWSRGLYDTEPYQFGGQTGIGIAHRFFTVESLAVLAFHRQRLRGDASLDPFVFSLLLIDLLLREVTGDAWERWDVWCRMESTGRALRLSDEAQAAAIERSRVARQAIGDVIGDPERAIRGLSSGERRIVDEYRRALPAIASELNHAHDHGQLLWGVRTILPFWIVFHWNRMAFDLHEQRWLTFLMTTLLSPRAG